MGAAVGERAALLEITGRLLPCPFGQQPTAKYERSQGSFIGDRSGSSWTRSMYACASSPRTGEEGLCRQPAQGAKHQD